MTLTGEVDVMLDPQLRSLERQFRAGGSESARVDLRSVTFFGSTGCHFLCELRETAQRRGGSVTLLAASPVCLRTLALVGLDTAFDNMA